MTRPSLFPNVIFAGNLPATPQVDMSGYVRTEDMATTATKDSVDLLRSQLQVVLDTIYTRPESDARYATKPELTTALGNFYTKTDANGRYATKLQINEVTFQLTENYALKSEVPGAGVWKALPLRAGFSTAAATGRQAQYRIQFGYIEMRGEVNRTGDYTVDTEYTFADLPAADRPAQWVYGNAASYSSGNPGLPGVVHIGAKTGGEVIAVPLIRSCWRLYLDNVRVSTFK
jgi:hypothetical protein